MGANLLYDRTMVVTVGTLQLEALAMKIKVKKDLKPKPNTAEIEIRNLNESHRLAIEENPAVTAQIEVGYGGINSVVFIGDLRTAPSEVDGPDVVTKLTCGDGEKKHRTARVKASHAKGSTSAQVLQSLVTALGVAPGNSAKAIAAINASNLGSLFSMGTVLCGSAASEMTRVLRAVGYTWSIQNGALQILSQTTAVAGDAIKLDQAHGLVGSPSIDADGVLSCKSLIVPDVFPGRLVVIQSLSCSGQFKISETEHTADTYGSDWYVSIKAKPY